MLGRVLGGKRGRVRYPLEPVWGVLGLFRDGRMTSEWGVSRLIVQRRLWSLLSWDWKTAGGGSRLLRCNSRGTHPLTATLCRGSIRLLIPVELRLGERG
jgi:hypothetical protein